MKRVFKYTPWILIALLAVGTGWYYNRSEATWRKLLQAENEKLQEANLELGRARTEVVSGKKLHAAAMSAVDKKWKDEIRARKGQVTLYAELKAKYEARGKLKPEVKYVTRVERDGRRILVPRQLKTLNEDVRERGLWYKNEKGEYFQITEIPFQVADWRLAVRGTIRPNGNHDLDYRLKQQFSLKLVETALPTGGYNHYAELVEENPDGKPVGKMKLTGFRVRRINNLEPRWSWWNPKIDLGFGMGVNLDAKFAKMGSLGVSFFSLGKTPNDLSLRVLRPGIGLSNGGLNINLSPVQWNLGTVLPLVSNLWLTPTVGWEPFTGVFDFYLGFAVVL